MLEQQQQLSDPEFCLTRITVYKLTQVYSQCAEPILQQYVMWAEQTKCYAKPEQAFS
jgi:hypothetical protein